MDDVECLRLQKRRERERERERERFISTRQGTEVNRMVGPASLVP